MSENYILTEPKIHKQLKYVNDDFEYYTILFDENLLDDSDKEFILDYFFKLNKYSQEYLGEKSRQEPQWLNRGKHPYREFYNDKETIKFYDKPENQFWNQVEK